MPPGIPNKYVNPSSKQQLRLQRTCHMNVRLMPRCIVILSCSIVDFLRASFGKSVWMTRPHHMLESCVAENGNTCEANYESCGLL